jgi:hypothetical protein
MDARKAIIGAAAIESADAIGARPRTAAPEPKAAAVPDLRLEEYFLGSTEAWGVFQDRFGKLRRQFKVMIDGTWDGAALTLDEHFLYTDGERQRRVWRLTKTGPNTWDGRADDVIGVAQGRISANELSWIYQVRLPVGRNGLVTTFDDRMWLQPDGVLINRATVRKFGVRIAEATITFKRPDAA